MSIVLICGNGTTDRDQYQPFIDLLNEQIRKLNPNLTIEDWPNVKDPNAIDCAIAWMPDNGVFSNFPHLKSIFSLGAGVDHILKDPNLPAQASLTRIIDPGMATQMAQYVTAAVLNVLLKTPYFAELQRKKEWNRMAMLARPPKKVGIMGLGQLGAKVATCIKNMDIQTLGWSTSQKHIDGVECYASNHFDTFIQQCDILVSLLPLTKDTKHLLNTDTLNKLPDGAHVINVSRGDIVVETDLIKSLDSGKLSGATLDVFSTEPLPANNPLWQHPKVTVTPHVSAITNPTTVCHQLVDNYHALQNNLPLIGLVDTHRGY